MSKISTVLLIMTAVAMLLVAVYKFYMELGHSDHTDTPQNVERYKIRWPSDEPIHADSLSMNIYETICEIGPPVMVKGWSLDPETRFVFFEGPFLPYSSSPGSQKTHAYLRMDLDTIDAERATSTELLDSLGEYKIDETPADLDRFRIPILSGVPDRLDVLTGLLGEWTVAHERKSEGARRLVYAQKMCINQNLVEGAYFDVVKGRVVKAKGISTKERLSRVVNDIRTPRPDAPDKEPIRYVDQTPEEGTAEYTLIHFIRLREAGKQEEALRLLSDDQENEWLRNHITTQTEPGANIDLNQFYYQAVKRTNTEVVFEYEYRLDNGGLMDFGHTVVLENGYWKIHH